MADVKKYLDLAGLRTLWGQVEIHVQNSIAAENSDRVEAERALEEKITAEIVRATGVEGELRTEISNEVKARIAAVSELSQEILSEAERAQGVERELRGLVDAINNPDTGILAQAIAHVAEREEVLNEKIDEVETALEGHKVAYNEKVSALEAKDVELVNAIGTKVEKTAYEAKVVELQGAIDSNLEVAKKYTDDAIIELVGNAPETMDTLKELSDAIKEHGTVVDGYIANVDKKIDSAKEELEGKINGLHKAQVYNVTCGGEVVDTTCIDEAVASLVGVKFGGGDIIVITDAQGISAAYQFDDNNGENGAWEALSGNVNAANVIFKQDFTLAGNYTAIGNVTKSSNAATGTLEANGKSVMEVFMSMFTKTLQPGNPTQPAVSLTFSQAKAYEVGTMVTPSFSASLSAGSYTYGPSTGVTAQSWTVTDTAGNSASANTGSFPQLQVVDGINYKITATASHNQGAIAKNNIGGESSPVVRIAAGNKSATSGAITGYRQIFAGSSAVVKEINSANIRALSTKRQTGTVTDWVVSIVEGAKQVVIAMPKGRTLKNVKDQGAFGTDIVGSFVKQVAPVEGANGYVAQNYDVYVYQPAAALGANTYKVTIG